MKAFAITLSLALLWTTNAAGQGIFRTAQLLANRSATQNCLTVEDADGNQYLAITFYDTLKLKHPDQTLSVRNFSGRAQGRAGVALLKLDRNGRRLGSLVLTDSTQALQAQQFNLLPSGDLELSFFAAGALLANGIRLQQNPTPAGQQEGPGYALLDTSLRIRQQYQCRYPKVGAYISTVAATGPSHVFISSFANTDTVQLNGQRFVAPAYLQGQYNQYAYVAQMPKAAGPTQLIYFWTRRGSQGAPSISRIDHDADGNCYITLSAYQTGDIYMNDSVIASCRDAGAVVIKLGPGGRKQWASLIAAKYGMQVTAMAASPLQDKIYLAFSVLGRSVLAGQQFDTDTVISPSCPQTYLGAMGALVLDAETGAQLHASVFRHRHAHYTFKGQMDRIVVNPYGEVYWGGSIQGNPTLFGGPPVQGWQTLFVAATGPNLELRWISRIGGPVDGTERQLVSMRYSPYWQELQLVGGLTSWPQATAVGVGNTIVSATRPALFTAALQGLRLTGMEGQKQTLAPYPNPATTGSLISAGIGGTGRFALADATGRRFACTSLPDGRLRLPQVVAGVYTLLGPQGQKARLVIQP